MVTSLSFRHPEPEPHAARIWPVFLPFAGCPYRCVYCAQDKQTGHAENNLETIVKNLEEDLDQALVDNRGPYELAFYGGTFTALPKPWPEILLGVAMRYRERGLITHVRCSTRPDCVDDFSLSMLRAQGLDMVELGIQSFDDQVLRYSGRDYTGDVARTACETVKRTGLNLGIQLLPGLPGDRPGIFQMDARIAASFEPEIARIYPCLVIRDTPLEKLWRVGNFSPWDLNRTKRELAEALLTLWDKNVRVIRLGLPPEGALAEHILAGPWHPALGQSARGHALLEVVKTHMGQMADQPTLLEVPRRYQGELLGHANELLPKYEALGLQKSSLKYTSAKQFTLSG